MQDRMPVASEKIVVKSLGIKRRVADLVKKY